MNFKSIWINLEIKAQRVQRVKLRNDIKIQIFHPVMKISRQVYSLNLSNLSLGYKVWPRLHAFSETYIKKE